MLLAVEIKEEKFSVSGFQFRLLHSKLSGNFFRRIAMALNGMTRRQFSQLIGVASALGLIEKSQIASSLPLSNNRRLSWLAYRNPSAEGAWTLTNIEGKAPRELNGTLYRIAPGQKENHGVALKHLFDGDAFISGYSFRAGKVTLRAQFIDLPERLEELKANRMIYAEFGTMPPPQPDGKPAPRKSKNQPSVNVIYWDSALLGLSEGGHPTEIDPANLAYRGRHDFYGSLPRDVPFTAHPKFDPSTGEGYGFGVQQGMGTALKVYRMNPDGKLTQLYSLPQKGYFMIHDMLLGKEHLIFVIPPVRFDLPTLFSGKATPAEALRYFEKEPTRFLILRRDGQGQPVTIEQPANMVFHHGNAFERDGKITIDTFLSPDHSILEALYSWSKDKLPESTPPRLTRLILDPVKGSVDSRTELADSQEFPRFDSRRSGDDARYLYTLESTLKEDTFANNALVRRDFKLGASKRIEAGKMRTFGEAVFVPHPNQKDEDRGWLLMQGYDASRDENFLEIRDAGTMDFEARVWTGRHFPLGFHGNFTTASFLSA
jgi:all-trans-8'-apo-beta-carotenal 15,15'-oxygenase